MDTTPTPDRNPKPALERISRGFIHSVGVRLFVWLFGAMVVVFAGYAYLNIRATSEQWTQVTHQAASRKSDLIKRATRYGMLLNRKEDVHNTIRMIAEVPGVSGVRIYDKRGEIIFSAEESEIGREVDLQAEACVICHDHAEPLQSVPAESRVRVYRGPDGGRVLGLISPIENAPECSDAACHAHPADTQVLGVLDVKMSMAYADERLQATINWMIVATLLMALLIGGVSVLFIYRVVRVPVKGLIRGTESIARGDLKTRIEVESHDEIGQLAQAFNRMTGDLDRAREEITEWSRMLEKKIEEKTEQLGRVHLRMVHMEKMASLGKLAATVAHELNNPLAGVLTYSKLVARELDRGEISPDDRDEVCRYLTLIQKETARCGQIVQNLLVFARKSGTQFAAHHLNPIIERSLMLVRHHLELAGIKLKTDLLDEDDTIVCDEDQVQQALVAILVNAVEAMTGGGTLSVRVSVDGEQVRLEISDTGAGIPPEILPHLFEPFFSTKEGMNGVGLGLAVVYGIVQAHGGRIDVDTKPGVGTTFRVLLPRRQNDGAGEKKDAQRQAGVA